MIKTRLHYAWIILVLVFLALSTGSGMRLAFGSFVHPWQETFNVSRGVISMIATLSFVFYGLFQPVLGRWADKRGAGGVLAFSLVAVGVGLLLSRYATAAWQLGLAFGVISSIGFAGVSQVTAAVAVTRWFEQRRGLALGILTLALGVGQMIFVPASIFLNHALGWQQTILIYGLGLLALAPLVLWLIKPSPASIGTRPYGAAVDGGAAAQASSVRQPQLNIGLWQLLATPGFWWLALPFFVCGVTTTGMIDTHLVPFAEDHHLPQGATATAVAVLALFNSAGILAAGYFSDRLPRRYMLAFLYGMRAVTLLFLISVSSPAALIAFAAVYGLVDFSTVPPTSSLAAELFGAQRVGLVFGLISLSHQLGSAVGAFVPGVLYDLTGSYQLSFLLGAGTLVAASLLSLLAHEQPRRKAPAVIELPSGS